jgi:hypothetical protein
MFGDCGGNISYVVIERKILKRENVKCCGGAEESF